MIIKLFNNRIFRISNNRVNRNLLQNFKLLSKIMSMFKKNLKTPYLDYLVI